MKLGIIVQRYGSEINGGAELHARYIAERLARHVSVEVLTTCARDYITWGNGLPSGVDDLNGVPIRRFQVSRVRDPIEFGRRSRRVFEHVHSVRDELAWLDSEGPLCPSLVSYVRRQRSAFDFFVFFSYRYYHAFHGARAAGDRAVLVPTAERDPVAGLSIFGPVFRGVRAIMYNSVEEREMIQGLAHNDDVPGVVVGVGSDVPARVFPDDFRRKTGIRGRVAVYVGRIDKNKGCEELFDFFLRYVRGVQSDLTLVLIGESVLPIPSHPRVRHLGFLPDQDKFNAIAAADLLIMPSFYESLSMVALEAWALGRPVLANGRCDVLRGQCIRSNAGLYYETYAEFAEALYSLETSRPLNRALGFNGREFFQRNYSWPVIERKYLDMLDRLKAESRAREIEPLPGWLARWRRNIPASQTLVARSKRVSDAGDSGPRRDSDGERRWRSRPQASTRQRFSSGSPRS